MTGQTRSAHRYELGHCNVAGAPTSCPTGITWHDHPPIQPPPLPTSHTLLPPSYHPPAAQVQTPDGGGLGEGMRQITMDRRAREVARGCSWRCCHCAMVCDGVLCDGVLCSDVMCDDVR